MLENALMDYLTFKLWKVGLLLVAVFIWQFWRGFNGLPVEREQRDTEAGSSPQDRPKR